MLTNETTRPLLTISTQHYGTKYTAPGHYLPGLGVIGRRVVQLTGYKVTKIVGVTIIGCKTNVVVDTTLATVQVVLLYCSFLSTKI